MISMDLLSLFSGVISFVAFLILQLVLFRWIKPERLLRMLMLLVVVVSVFPIILMILFYEAKFIRPSTATWIMGMLVASCISFLLSFVYILCIFGPYETSVRIRLIREIASGGRQGIDHGELLKRYNAKGMADLRLKRLIGSGDIVEKDGKYMLQKRQNVFFLFDSIASLLKKWINA